MEYKKLLLELLHRTEAISMTLQEILSENNLNTALEHLNKKNVYGCIFRILAQKQIYY